MPPINETLPRLGLRHGCVAKERHLHLTETSCKAIRSIVLAYQLWCQRPVADAVVINRAVHLLARHATSLLASGDQDAITAELVALEEARS